MRNSVSLTLALLAFGPILCPAQSLKVTEQNGHVSPVRARLTFQNDRVREAVVNAMGYSGGYSYPAFTHAFFVRTDGGASKRTLWIDSLAAIKGLENVRTTRSEFTIVLKNGTQFSALFVGTSMGGGSNCDAGLEFTDPNFACTFLFTGNDDEGHEIIDMRKLKSIEFLPAARRDKTGNFMFDTWRFSPFTGEKLPSN